MTNLHQILIRFFLNGYNNMEYNKIMNVGKIEQLITKTPLPGTVKESVVGGTIPSPLDKYNQDKNTGGVKHDLGKTPLDLLPMGALFEVGEILKFGAAKYAAYNWAKGMSYSRLIAASLRHIFAFNQGQDLDPETNRSHIAHALCCLLFLMEYEHRKEQFKQFDDRYKW